jgi:hypothetical protein
LIKSRVGGGGDKSVDVMMRERFETNVAASENWILFREGFSVPG